jgi:ATP-dependent Clp protease ATP-binding subunit ClpB
VGYEDGGYLTEVVRRKPYAVILIDQVEKTHPDVFNILLQVLDDGRLTDSQGRMASFTNTIVIMTTHLGSECLHRLVDNRNAVQLRNEVLLAVQEHFRPELINPIDDMIVFESLQIDQLNAVARIEVLELTEQLLSQGLGLSLTGRALDVFGARGDRSRLCARPMRRVLQKRFENPLVEALLMRTFQPGDNIVVDAGNEGLTFAPPKGPQT